MRYIEWAVMFVVAGLGIGLANFVGFDVNFMDSLPGILILLAISLVAVVISKLVPLKLPIIAYCSILGLLVACPISPVREGASKRSTRLTSRRRLRWLEHLPEFPSATRSSLFLKQGWKMILIGILVMTGTFLGSALIAQIILSLTHAI